MAAQPSNTVHFVGSVCLPDEDTVMRRLCAALPTHLRRIPDGETGQRGLFVIFQRDVFKDSPFVQAPFPPGSPSKGPQIEPGPDSPPVKLSPLGYDENAIASYEKFCKLRTDGVIPKGIRFQVSLPTPVNVLGNLIEPAWRETVEPVYEAALLAALRRLQDHIPAEDLAVQWDLASEFAYLEGAASSPPWFSPTKQGLVQRILKAAAAVDEGVELGFHLCYGDFGHKHFVEPKDTALLVEIGNAILSGAARQVNWLHMPVPKSRTDTAYFEPLKKLELGSAELYLGLLHPEDEEGTRKRIETASMFVSPFGLATECGLGRSSQADLDSILEIAASCLPVCPQAATHNVV